MTIISTSLKFYGPGQYALKTDFAPFQHKNPIRKNRVQDPTNGTWAIL